MKFKPTLCVDFRAETGRRTFNVGLESFSEDELLYLAQTFANADRGSFVEFGIGQTEDGRRCMQFIIGRTEAKVAALES